VYRCNYCDTVFESEKAKDCPKCGGSYLNSLAHTSSSALKDENGRAIPVIKPGAAELSPAERAAAIDAEKAAAPAIAGAPTE
jgi:predicted  nucleic acid-binding Zn-ribbon protein